MVADDCFGEWTGRIGHFQAKSTDFYFLFQKLIRKSVVAKLVRRGNSIIRAQYAENSAGSTH